MVTLAAPITETSVSAVRIIQAPIAQVYAAFAERDPIRRWLADEAEIRAAVGGHTLLTWQGGHFATGQYTALDKNEHIAFNWRAAGQAHDTSVDVRLHEENGATTVELAETGFAPDADLDATQATWNKRLDTLQATLENGEDIRITHRVIIGIFPADFNEEIGTRLGIPVKEGARVGSLVPGYSAAAAGLQNDDVIVAINGQAVNDQTPIGTQVRANKPGDVVEVTYYRGSEKTTIPVSLKGYPVPEKADSFIQLGDRIEKTYRDIDAELDGLFDNHSEADAKRNPSEKEWSANQVMAHLIMSERWLHNALGTYMDAPEANGWSCNHVARINAVTTMYPTSADLLAELRRGHAETALLLRNIPAETGERKNLIWHINFQLEGMVQHSRQHINQIGAALGKA
jgi:uncharacterized protein YndB with AHSA1/START domain